MKWLVAFKDLKSPSTFTQYGHVVKLNTTIGREFTSLFTYSAALKSLDAVALARMDDKLQEFPSQVAIARVCEREM